MKRLIAVLLAMVMLLATVALVACGDAEEQTTEGNEPADTNEATTGTGDENEEITEPDWENLVVESFSGEYVWKDSVSQLAANWNPHTYEVSDDNYPIGFISSGLYEFVFNDELHPVAGKDPYTGYKVVPEMAAAMPVDVTEQIKAQYPHFDIPEDATSGYAYVIDLNPNAQWQNGTKINADTYIYSMKQLLDPDMLNYRATDYLDGDFCIANGMNYYYQGTTNYNDNGIANKLVLADLVKNEDGTYSTKDGNKMFIAVNYPLDWTGGNTLKQCVDAYGENYFGLTKWEELVAAMDANGMAPLTDATYAALLATTTTNSNWGETEADAFNYFLEEVIYEDNYSFDKVGLMKTGEYQITLVLDKSLAGFNLLYNLSGNWIVYEPYYEANKQQVEGAWLSTYNTSVETTMSYGPYKMVSYQTDKAMRFEKNENWHGYSDKKHVYKDPEDGKIYPMYQTTAVDCQVVAEAETRKLMFLKGQLMGYGLQAEDYDTYRGSEYCYATPAETIYFLILNGHKEAIANREAAADFDKAKYDLECMTLTSFKQALALSYDKELFASTISPSRSGGYGLIGDNYIYDPETGARYRDTDAAKKALCDFYAVDVSKYGSLDEAVESITGYDVEGAKKFFKQAFDEAIEAGFITDTDNDGKSDQTIRMEYCLSADSDFMTQTINYLNTALAEVLAGTPFEGKIEFVKSAIYGTEWSEKIKGGLADTVLGGWSGSALNPFSLTDLYVNPSRAYDAYWFNASAVDMTHTINGEEITMTLTQWSDALNGKAVTVGEKTYNFGDGQADIEVRLGILAAFETAILKEYNYLPMLQDGSMALLSQQVYYVVEEYNPVMGRGGMTYAKYNFDETEWAAYIAEQGGELKY